jgi:hypothetical protein
MTPAYMRQTAKRVMFSESCSEVSVLFIRDKPNLSPERRLHKDYDRKGSVKKNLVVNLKGLGAKTACLVVN